ncbi:MAG: hypothetical protein QHH75_12125 [Bacillota bacterium]|nr:hypothetical protein [Bacillota bacterium]
MLGGAGFVGRRKKKGGGGGMITVNYTLAIAGAVEALMTVAGC